MISMFINVRTLKHTTNRISTVLFRNKTNKACAPNQLIDSNDPNLPIEMKNPYKKKRRLCTLCKLNIEPDYKNVRLLSQFQSRHTGRIYGKHITGLCEYKQKRLEEEIIKAQRAGLMGYMTKDPNFYEDPMLFNPNFPLRPHKF